jgi:hypothetical protein
MAQFRFKFDFKFEFKPEGSSTMWAEYALKVAPWAEHAGQLQYGGFILKNRSKLHSCAAFFF